MGVSLFFSDDASSLDLQGDGNPDKYNYIILSERIIGEHVLVRMMYPDCFNYGGKKILLYELETWKCVKYSDGGIDPHFLEDNKSPIARFAPTDEGELLALKVLKDLDSN